MSTKVSLQQLQKRLVELLDEIGKTDQAYVVQRNGKDCAVHVDARRGGTQRLQKVDRLCNL